MRIKEITSRCKYHSHRIRRHRQCNSQNYHFPNSIEHLQHYGQANLLADRRPGTAAGRSGTCPEYAVSVVIIISLFFLLAVQAQLLPAAVNPEDEAAKFAGIGSIIVQSRIQKANLPDDLLISALEVALNARTADDGCKTTLGTNHVIWQYRLCVVSNLKVANLAISQLETEARAREAAAAAAAAAATAPAAA